MPSYSRLEAIDDEGYDDEGYDDEGIDDEGVMDVLGGILNPAAAIGNLVGGMFGGGAPRPPLQRVSAPPAGGGVSTATLNTPQGSATLRLPETVVTRSDFDTGIRTLQDAVNADSARINSVSKDLDTLRTRMATVVSDSQRDLGKLRTELRGQRRANRAALARMRREQSQQNMMNIVVTMMMSTNQQSTFNEHVHTSEAVGTDTSAPTGAGSSSSSSSMMLPLMMMMGSQSDGNSSDSSMNMMLPLMFMMMPRG
jgi:hypothetical protein